MTKNLKRLTPPLVACFSLLVWLTVGGSGVGADRTQFKIYEPIDESYPCFRKLNGTHQVGCGSGLTGDVGVVYLVDDDASLNWVVKDGPHDPYIALIYPDYMSHHVMRQFKMSDRVSGVLVLNSTSRIKKMTQFSTDLTCPNKGFGFYTNASQEHYCEKWNSGGEGILFERFDFPVFYVQNETKANEILDCYYKFNHPIDNATARDWPLCAAQLKSFMLAAVDTPTCLRRSEKFNLEQQSQRVCDPMGDYNLWCSILPSNQSEPYKKKNGSVIVISAKLDSASMFEGLARGADSAATGIVTFLSVLKHLSDQKDFLKDSLEIDNVYFILFHGESFGYIGSSRMVYDMKKGFPSGITNDTKNSTAMLNITDIKYYIEIGQVGLTEDTPYFIHTTDSSETSKLSQLFIDEGKELNLSLQLTGQQMGFPPSSLQSFLKERPSLPAVFVSNHNREFRNKFYNSMFDDQIRLQYRYQDLKSIPTVKISQLAATIANTVLRIAVPNLVTPSPVVADFNTTDELMHCYVETGNCPLFQKVAGIDKMQPSPMDLYVGVNRHRILATQLTHLLMIYYQGVNSTTIKKAEDCKTPDAVLNVDYQWINGSCFTTTVNFSEALSPAFVIENYDWSSGTYSSWSESVWQQFSVRIFLKPSRRHEVITLVSGILVFLISFVIIGWFSSKSDMIFPTRPAIGMAC